MTRGAGLAGGGGGTLEIVQRFRLGMASGAGSLTEGTEESKTTRGPDSPSSIVATSARGIFVRRGLVMRCSSASSALHFRSSASMTARLWRWHRSSTALLILPLYTKMSLLVTVLTSVTFCRIPCTSARMSSSSSEATRFSNFRIFADSIRSQSERSLSFDIIFAIISLMVRGM